MSKNQQDKKKDVVMCCEIHHTSMHGKFGAKNYMFLNFTTKQDYN